MLMNLNRIFVLSLLLVVVGCAHDRHSVGEKLVTQGAETKDIGKKWIEGEELIKKGHKLIQNGEHLRQKGEAEIREGRDLVRKGNKKIKKSENIFQDKYPELVIEKE